MRPLLALALLALAGCSSFQSSEPSAIPAERLLAFQQPAASTGEVQVERDVGFLGGGCLVAFNIDGQLAARVGPGETGRFQVPAGGHVVGITGDLQGDGLCAKARLRRELPLSLQSGQVARYRIISQANSGFDIHAVTP
ncbi:MAG: hypothetical protein GAK43_02467 [Stenotrophomonas maltophilia]|nr:MAG: hypothetical protein GAK43_02467 [Stenotrophomonas maltophilia]